MRRWTIRPTPETRRAAPAKRYFGFPVVYVRSEQAVRQIKGCDAESRYGQLTLSHGNGHSTRRVAPVSAWPQRRSSRDGLGHRPGPRVCSCIQPFNGAIEEALGDWEDDLNALFDEPPRNLGDGRPLLPEDRRLPTSLALRQTGRRPRSSRPRSRSSRPWPRTGGARTAGLLTPGARFPARFAPGLKAFKEAIQG